MMGVFDSDGDDNGDGEGLRCGCVNKVQLPTFFFERPKNQTHEIVHPKTEIWKKVESDTRRAQTVVVSK